MKYIKVFETEFSPAINHIRECITFYYDPKICFKFARVGLRMLLHRDVGFS